MPTYRTTRLLLRPALPSDIPAMHEVFANPDVMHYWSTAPHTDLSQTERYMAQMIAAPMNGRFDFVIELLAPNIDDEVAKQEEMKGEEGRVIGKAGLWTLSPVAEYGIMLHRDCWGKGYAREVSEFLVGDGGLVWKSDEVGNRIIADVDPRNEASLKLLERVGFVETGRKEGTWTTHIGVCDSIYLEKKRPR